MMLLHITQLMVDPHLVLNQVQGVALDGIHRVMPILNDVASALQQLADKKQPTAFQQIDSFATNLKNFILGLGITIFIIGVAVAGIMRIVSFGSDRRIAMSNMALTAAVIGLVIMLMSTVMSDLLKQFFPNGAVK